jgi:hypothetical protein
VLKNSFTTPQHEFDCSLRHALVKHSQAKDQFLKVAIKLMMETQILEDDLKEVSELNSILFAEKQELETKWAKESQAKDGEHPINFFYLCNLIMSEGTLN